MAVEVRFRPLARADLFNLYDYIARHSGRERAGAYIDRIEAACMALANFPERGTRRDNDLGAGLRTIGFERRITVVFRVEADAVHILRVLYGGRDVAAAVRED